MTHLGTQLSALADGQLGPAETERALAHVAVCPECAAGLAAARSARRTIAEAFEVRPDPGLTARLLALGATPGGSPADDVRAAHRRPARGAEPTVPWPETSVPLPGTRQRIPADCLRGDVTASRGVPGRVLAGAGLSLGVAATLLFVLGGEPVIAPEREPAHALTVLARAGTASSSAEAADQVGVTSVQTSDAGATASPAGRPTFGSLVAWSTPRATPASADVATDPGVVTVAPEVVVGQWLEAHPWASPVELPDGYRLVGARVNPDGADGLEVDLAGYAGLVIVTQTAGCLDGAAVAGMEAEVAGREVYELSSAPWQLVWQSGDAVVSVVAEVRSSAAESVVESYPAQAYDDGVPARILRGWQVLAGAWNGS